MKSLNFSSALESPPCHKTGFLESIDVKNDLLQEVVKSVMSHWDLIQRRQLNFPKIKRGQINQPSLVRSLEHSLEGQVLIL